MQEIIKPNQYYFQFIPVSLHRKLKRSKIHRLISNDVELKFALYLDNSLLQQTAQWIQAQFVQNVLKCPNSVLAFSITKHSPSYLPSLSIQVLTKQTIKQTMTDYEPQQINNNQQQNNVSELGNCILDPSIYIQTFIDDRKAVFHENIQIASELSMNYEVYIEQSLPLLQKLVNKYRGTNNEGNMFVSAFKKIEGHRKVRYVQLDSSRQKSVKQQQFKRSHKLLIGSLRKIGSKYVPHKIVSKNSSDLSVRSSENSNRKKYDIQNEVNQLPNQQNCQKGKHRSLSRKTDKSKKSHKNDTSNMKSSAFLVKNHIKNSSTLQKKPQLKIQLVKKYTFQQCLLIIFCILSLLLLSISMFPSKKI